jgi:hypothetical protein
LEHQVQTVDSIASGGMSVHVRDFPFLVENSSLSLSPFLPFVDQCLLNTRSKNRNRNR